MSALIISRIFCVLALVCCWKCCYTQSTVQVSNSSVSTDVVVVEEDNDPYLYIRRLWIDADKAVKRVMSKLIKAWLPDVMRQIYSRNITAPCLTSLLQVTNALKKGKLWPFKMVDASGKLPEGFLAGALTILGDYNECLSIQVNTSKVKVNGSYCLVDIIPPTPKWRPFMSTHIRVPELINVSEPDSLITHLSGFVHNMHVTTLKTGLCVPSQCTKDDVQNLIDLIPEYANINWEFKVSRCEQLKETSFNLTQTCILYVFGVLATLIGIGCLLDVFCSAENVSQTTIKGTIFHVFHAFSFPANARKLANYTCEDEKLRFVYGAMFFSLLWIVIANTFMYVNYDVSANILQGLRMSLHLFYEIVLHRSIPIQTFFFLSGFVSAYRIFKNPEKEFCVWKYLLNRYLRYTPVYIMLIMLTMTVPTWGSAPTWQDKVGPFYDKCSSKWWTNILYINNFMDQDKACLDHTWLFAVDAQLHLIGIFVLIPLKRMPKLGLTVNFLLMLAGLLTVGLTNAYYELPPNEMMAFFGPRDRVFYARHTYLRVYTHLCVYCAGIASGYFMGEKPKFQLSRLHTWIVGMLTVAGAMTIITLVHEWKTGIIPSPLISALYASLGKLAWAAFLSWITITCMSGRGGALHDVLSWRAFSFFGRLTFATYLLHPVVITVAMAFQKTHLYIEDFQILYVVVSHLGGTYILAYCCHLAFESPFVSLMEVAKRKTRSSVFTSNIEFSAGTSTACNGVVSEKPAKYKGNDGITQTRTKF